MAGNHSGLEYGFINLWRGYCSDLPEPVHGLIFEPKRKWELDLAWPDYLVAVEIEGGTGRGVRGRHVQPKGFFNDCDKYNRALELGWRLFRFTGQHINSQPVQCVERVAKFLRKSEKV